MARSVVGKALVLASLAAAIGGCSAAGSSDSRTGPGGAAGAGGAGADGGELPFDAGLDDAADDVDAGELDGCHAVDVLFAIDDSGSMGDKQAALVQAFPSFVATMRQRLAHATSWHVGVVTSDDYWSNPQGCQQIGDLVVATAGPDSSNATCGPFGGHAYMDGADPALDAQFSCAAQVGAGGADDERQMRGLLNALQPARNQPGACNAGFARPDSLLVVVLITDEDDAADTGCDPLSGSCNTGSGGTSTDWYDELVAYRGGVADNVVVLTLANDGSCAGSIGAHVKGFTLKFKHGVVGNVCSLDYGQFFADALPTIGAACEQWQAPR